VNPESAAPGKDEGSPPALDAPPHNTRAWTLLGEPPVGRLLLVAAVALASALSARSLGASSLWFDETTSVEIARLEWLSLLDYVVHEELNMSFYHALLHIWISVIGDSEAAVRSLSIVTGVAAIPVLYVLGKRLFGWRVGVVASLLLATNVVFVEFAREARGYALLVLLVTASSYLFVRALDENRWLLWAAFILVSAAAVYTHFFAALVVLAQATSLPFRGGGLPWARLASSGVLVSLLALPVVLYVALGGEGSKIDWLPAPTLTSIYTFFRWLTETWAIFLVFFFAGGAALVLTYREWVRKRCSVELWRYALVLLWLAIPVLTAFAVSFVKPVFYDRYLVVSLPPLILLVARALCEIRSRTVLAAVVLGIVALSVRAELNCHDCKRLRDDWRTATAYVLSNAQPGDGIFFDPGFLKTPFDYYAQRRAASDARPRLLHPRQWRLTPDERYDIPLSLEEARAQRRVWLVQWSSRFPTAVEDTLLTSHEITQTREFEGFVQFALYTHRRGRAQE
jgi:uncharacterized membrane protein